MDQNSNDISKTQSWRQWFKELSANDAIQGVFLIAAALLALIIANTPWGDLYETTLQHHVAGLSLVDWVNDALMAIFFLLVGLEIKRELLNGQLASWSSRILPGLAALGGMIVPALIYTLINFQSSVTLSGWAIPAATDIAFALGVIALLGSRVPTSLKLFLATLAIIDDLGAIVIIALFYTSDLNLYAVLGAIIVTAALFGINRAGIRHLAPYLILGVCLWYLVFLTGVHATLSGVILALTIPASTASRAPQDAEAPLVRLENFIAPWVGFLIIPLFGFANAGISLTGGAIDHIFSPIPLGIAAGLLLGKQLGIFSMLVVAIKSGWARLPENATWPQAYGVSLLGGIGFTMSLFISLLAFPDQADFREEAKIGILMGSILSGIIGYLILLATTRSTDKS